MADASPSRRVLVTLAPMALVPLLYRAMVRFRDAGLAGRVHLCDLRDLEARWSGLALHGRPANVHDWLQAHAWLPLDVLCAIPYGAFVVVCVVFGAFASLRDTPRGRRFAWSFVALNVVGFLTYHLFPAAPPWYFHAHGCTVDLSTVASEGPNLAHVDAWLGAPLFASMYARSSAVFGAMPSLHCAYALLVALEGWGFFGPRGRAVAVGFASLMAFAAVYLDHHWVLDVFAGQLCASGVFLFARAMTPRSALAVARSS